MMPSLLFRNNLKTGWKRSLTCLLLGAILAALSTYRICDPDIWLYLRSGETLLSRGEILTEDIFSYTRPGHSWVNHSWLAQGVFAAFFQGLGTAGLYLARYLLLGGAFYFVFRSIRLKTTLVNAAGFTLISLLAASERFVVRPELFTFLFLALTVWILERERGRRRSGLLLLPPLFLLWANLHGGFILGLAILAAYCLGEGAMLVLKLPRGDAPTESGQNQILPPKRHRRLILAAIASAGAALINPNGLRAFLYSSHIAPLRPFIYAWQPFPWEAWPNWTLSQYCSAALLSLATFSLISGWRRINLSHLAVLIIFGLAAIRATRNTISFAFIAPALMAHHWPARMKSFRREGSRAESLLLLLLTLVLIGALLRPALEKDPGRTDIHKVFGFGISPFSYPLEAAELIAKERIEGNFFNSYGIGNYLTWRLWPEKRIYVDGRLSVFGADFLLHYNLLLTEPRFFPGETEEWGFRGAVVDYVNPSNLLLLQWLESSPEWRLVFFDTNSAIYLRSDHPDLARLEAGLSSRMDAAGNLNHREAFARGRFLLQVGRAEQALAFLRRAEIGYPRAPSLQGMLAWAYLELGDFARGGSHLERIETAGAEVPSRLALRLGDLSFQTGDFRRAARWYEKVGEEDEEYPRSRVYLGGSYARIDELDRARDILTRSGKEYPAYFEICEFNLAVIALRRGEKERARFHLRSVKDPAILQQIADDKELSELLE